MIKKVNQVMRQIDPMLIKDKTNPEKAKCKADNPRLILKKAGVMLRKC